MAPITYSRFILRARQIARVELGRGYAPTLDELRGDEWSTWAWKQGWSPRQYTKQFVL